VLMLGGYCKVATIIEENVMTDRHFVSFMYGSYSFIACGLHKLNEL